MKMLSNYFTYMVIGLGLIFTSCDTLLDVEASNTISGEILSNTENIQSALNGAYFNMAGINTGGEGGELLGGDFIVFPELLGRVSSSSGVQEYRWETTLADEAYNDFRNKNILATNARVQSNWSRAYETINLVNSILANINNVQDANERDRIEGEALAIRGILYFEMVLLWGPQYDAPGVDPTTTLAIPIRTEPIVDINEIPKLSASDLKSVADVYDQAAADLTQAAALLEDFGTNGTNLSYYACQAYLAKLNLQKGFYIEAESFADEVISSGQYSLASSPLLAFNNPSNSPEDVFAIQQTLANNTGDRNGGSGVTAFFSSLTESGLGVYRVFSNVFTDSSRWHNSPYFQVGDIRGTVDANVDESTVNTELNTAYYQSIVDQFAGILSTSKFTSSQYVLPIVRLAEMYLIRAEANYFKLNETLTNQAVDDLNAVRTRAGLQPLTVAQFPNQDAFFDSLVIERTREFMHEGMILEDVKRWGGFIGTRNNSNFEFDPWDEEFILPIPQSELDTWN